MPGGHHLDLHRVLGWSVAVFTNGTGVGPDALFDRTEERGFPRGEFGAAFGSCYARSLQRAQRGALRTCALPLALFTQRFGVSAPKSHSMRQMRIALARLYCQRNV